MGKLSSLSGKERTRLIVSVACLPVIAAAGVALVIGNSWAFGDGASTMNTYLTTPAPADTSAMTRSSSRALPNHDHLSPWRGLDCRRFDSHKRNDQIKENP